MKSSAIKNDNIFIPTDTERQVTYLLMYVGLTPNQIDSCIFWAFGKGAWNLAPYPDWLTRWRKLHPEFEVKDSWSFRKWIMTVGFLYFQYLNWIDKQKKKSREN